MQQYLLPESIFLILCIYFSERDDQNHVSLQGRKTQRDKNQEQKNQGPLVYV